METLAQDCIVAVTRVLHAAVGPQTVAAVAGAAPAALPPPLAVPGAAVASEAAAAHELTDNPAQRGHLQRAARQIRVRIRVDARWLFVSKGPKTGAAGTLGLFLLCFSSRAGALRRRRDRSAR
jgi:hypothetical protein